jgi:transcriptional regulator with XRE-family HTH domain
MLLETLGDRLKFIQKRSGKNQADFADSLGTSKGSLILYQKNKRRPDSSLLKSLCEIYKVNPTWLLLGKDEPFLEGSAQEEMVAIDGKLMATDPVEQLLYEEEERAGITLTLEQRTAILKILRELVDRDMRSIRELLSLIPGREKKGDES